MPTWSTIRTQIKAEMDLDDEVFVTDAELLYYANQAIEEIEKEIHAMEDQSQRYFSSEANIALVADTSTYSLPTDIYAAKILGIHYSDGSNKYEIKPIRDLGELVHVETDDDYRYRLIDTTAGGKKIKIYPTSRETSSSNVTIYYRRKATQLASDSDNLDVPEATQFVKQFVIEKVANKERMTPDAPESLKLQAIRKNLLDSLENMVDDNNNEVGIDYSHYEESI